MLTVTRDTVEIHQNQPDITVGMDQKDSQVGDESKNKRGVSKLKYPVEHGTAMDWDDATKKSTAWLSSSTVWKIDVDSRTTATVNQGGLRLTPWKQDTFQRDLHEVSSRQQFHFRRASKHRVPDGSAGAH